jgi:hypothetical protein
MLAKPDLLTRRGCMPCFALCITEHGVRCIHSAACVLANTSDKVALCHCLEPICCVRLYCVHVSLSRHSLIWDACVTSLPNVGRTHTPPAGGLTCVTENDLWAADEVVGSEASCIKSSAKTCRPTNFLSSLKQWIKFNVMSIHAYGMMNMLCSVVLLCNKHQEARKCKHRATVLSRSLEYNLWSSLMTEEHPI